MGIKVVAPFENGNDEKTKLGNFTIQFFPLEHDVVNFGMFIKHESMGSLLFLTDTCYCKYSFAKQKVNHFLIEANYSMDLVDKDKPNYEHILQGHMSIDTTCKFLEVNNNPMLRNVILCHLSNSNSDSEDFIKRAEKVVDCPVYVAEKGLQVSLNLIPF